MPYDLAILDDFGKPLRNVSLGVNSHYKLISLAKNKKLYFISRMSDYYADTKYQISEIGSLKMEFKFILDDVDESDLEIRNFLINALKLVDEAILQKKAVEGIAD